MENQPMQTVKAFITAVQQGNFEQVGSLLHPDVQWNQPGNNRFSGIKKSSAEVFQMVGGMLESCANTLRLTAINALAVSGDSVACFIRWEGTQPAGRVLGVDNIDVYTVEDGKIIDARIYSADILQEDTFWGK